MRKNPETVLFQDEAMATNCLAFLEQMLNEEQEKESRGYYKGVLRDFTTRDALYTIIMLIKERQANAV